MSSIHTIQSSTNKKSKTLYRNIKEINYIDLPAIISFLPQNQNAFYISRPSVNSSFLALGDIMRYNQEFELKIEFSNDNKDIESLFEKSPLFIGYKQFSSDNTNLLWQDFEFQKWFIPETLITNFEGKTYLISNSLDNFSNLESVEFWLRKVTPTLDIPPTRLNRIKDVSFSDDEIEWNKKINFALNKIEEKLIDKVVIARNAKIELESELDIISAIKKLEAGFNDCATFCIKEASSIFFGSTPEKLFSLNGNIIHTEALAGSTARGKNEKDDTYLAKELINNPKELEEHNRVVDYILDLLEIYTTKLTFDKSPKVKRLKNIQHLKTNISAQLKSEINILDLVNQLHPTPAVCGLPKKDAFSLIKELEYSIRGLYAGVFGWYNQFNNGEFFVGIRSALLKSNYVYAYAGCGIVKGSDPIMELKETELKLKPIFSLFSNEDQSK